MRAWILVLAVTLVAGAQAQTTQPSQSAARATPAEAWVGTWTGKATWKSCSVDNGSRLALDIGTLGSVLTSDGDQILEGLGAVVWQPNGKKLTVARDGLDLSLTPGKKGVVKLSLTTAAGCTGKATLKRPTSGMASCDSVRALATVKSTCDNLDEATRDDDLVDIEGSWKKWKKLKGKKKKTQAKLCTARLDPLRAEVSSCAPAGGGTTLIASGDPCADVTLMIDKLLVCTSIPQASRDVLRDGIGQLKGLMTSPEMCQMILDQMKPALAGLGALGCGI